MRKTSTSFYGQTSSPARCKYHDGHPCVQARQRHFAELPDSRFSFAQSDSSDLNRTELEAASDSPTLRTARWPAEGRSFQIVAGVPPREYTHRKNRSVIIWPFRRPQFRGFFATGYEKNKRVCQICVSTVPWVKCSACYESCPVTSVVGVKRARWPP